MNKKVVWQSLLALTLGAGATYLTYICMSSDSAAKLATPGKVDKMVYIVSMFVAPFLAIAIHEAGHLAAGLVQGFRMEIYVVGFLGIKRKSDKIKVYFNKDLYYFGGMSATIPTKKYADIKQRFARIVIAGPLSSLASGILFLLAFKLTDTMLNSLWALCGIFSFAVFLGTTLPAKTGVFFTDRKRYQRLMDKGQTGDVELALLETINQHTVDNNFKNISPDKLAVIKTDKDRFIQFWGEYYDFQYHKEREAVELQETAWLRMNEYKNYLPKNIWKSLQIDQ